MSESQATRNFAIELLDDEHGINSSAWDTLADMLDDNGDSDIIDAVKSTEGRWYLPHDAAKLVREKTHNDED